MRRILKWMMILAVLLVAAIVGLTLFLGQGVKRAVEVVGPRLTKVDVQVQKVSVSLWSGRVEVDGLFIGNPEGYQSDSAIKLGSLVLATQPSSFFSDKVVVRRLDLMAPVITFEGGLKENNLSRILDNINERFEDTAGSGHPKEKKSDEANRKLQIDELVVANGKVHILMDVLSDRATTIDLPEIRLSNLGTGPEGITTAELTDRLLREIIDKATVVAARAIGGSVDDLTEGLKQAGQDAARKALDEAAQDVTNLLKRKN